MQSDDPGTDSRVEDWFGQSVERDAELADHLTEEEGLDENDAERRFEEQATGKSEQAARHGDQIDPDQGRSAYTDVDRTSPTEREAEQDPDSPGATIDEPAPAEPNEPG
jgi:hypothetical protein